MPPFAGEGMCAGVRDAVAMAWRPSGILEGKFGPGVLESYSSERIEHAKQYINFSQELGQIICISDEDAAAKRDAAMIAELDARGGAPVPTDVCHLGAGVWCGGSPHAEAAPTRGNSRCRAWLRRMASAVGSIRSWGRAGFCWAMKPTPPTH